MHTVLASPWTIWGVTAAAIAGVLVRPFAWPEAVWAVAGATGLVALGVLPLSAAWAGVKSGTDVYLFLTGMMLLAEIARQEGLFDWLAVHAARAAAGSASRLFALVYGVGTLVTIFLSNDATAVVLTPAVAAMTRAARVQNPLPYLFICAFIANAASFVLPISNPANLVIYGAHMPPLLAWLPRYALPSALSIAATYAILRFTQRRHLAAPVASDVAPVALTQGGATAAFGIAATAIVLMAASARGLDLGLPTALAGAATMLLVRLRSSTTLDDILAKISWGVLPLVAGLFVLVEALGRTGILERLSIVLRDASAHSAPGAAWATGIVLALASNLVNNLPAGLIAGHAVQAAHVPEVVTGAALIGVDLGPNLSVTGSLATILWLGALRREAITVSAWGFLRLGVVVMLPALLVALAAEVSEGLLF
jgi:arsenical pump membrane protein